MPPSSDNKSLAILSAEDKPAALDAAVKRSVERYNRDDAMSADEDFVSNEIPVALVYNGISHAVMMATPKDLQTFALGFSLSEGIIASIDECYGIEVVPIEAQVATRGLSAAYEIRLEIASRRFAELKEKRRSLSGRTGCGVCGVESLSSFDLNIRQVARPEWLNAIQPTILFNAFDALVDKQLINQQTGSVHAAGWVNTQGELVQVMEDVGRHNALDKLLGWYASQSRQELKEQQEPGFVIMTSRASYELIRKCALLDVPMLATISAPTALAIELAKQAQMRLYGLCRRERIVLYVP